jgi:hypothetical protein
MNNFTVYQATIHQPDFFPWVGFFDKIFKAEKLIIFDTVQLSTGKSWTNRVKILINGKEHWLTMPIKKKKRSAQAIYETEMIDPLRVYKKILKTLRSAYAKAPYFADVILFFEEIEIPKTNLLSDFNLSIIKNITRRLGNEKLEFVKCSDFQCLRELDLLQTDLIVEVCKYFQIKNYYSGSGCLSFLEIEKFKKNQIEISFQDFTCFNYSQIDGNQFVPGLSVIDALMNIGFNNLAEKLK